ncbi:hypothetical protein [Streptomyces sp. NPDC090022]|uniref:hypothetical protein n=1 Tax=Streptomyces sp. NPDC090022 TaxID=3365920 RepID=UPI003811E912
MDAKRSYGRLLVVSTLVLCLEATLTLVGGVLVAVTREPLHIDDYLQAAAAFVSLSGVLALVAALLSLLVVLPAVALGDLLGRLTGGRDLWAAVPLLVGVVLAPLAWAAREGGWTTSTVQVTWAVATAVLSVAALVGRLRREGLTGLVATRGTAFVVGAGLLGVFALWTDIVPRYRPPAITAAAVVGVWSDGRGGYLTFDTDGRVIAEGIDEFWPGGGSSAVRRSCSGPGTWTFTAGRTTWSQRVAVEVAGCALPEWSVSGTAARLELFHFIGDRDDDDRYELRKRDWSPSSRPFRARRSR